MIDKFTHMEVQKFKSVSVATIEVGFAEASTSTCGEVVNCASQAEVSMKEKGTSTKVCRHLLLCWIEQRGSREIAIGGRSLRSVDWLVSLYRLRNPNRKKPWRVIQKPRIDGLPCPRILKSRRRAYLLLFHPEALPLPFQVSFTIYVAPGFTFSVSAFFPFPPPFLFLFLPLPDSHTRWRHHHVFRDKYDDWGSNDRSSISSGSWVKSPFGRREFHSVWTVRRQL